MADFELLSVYISLRTKGMKDVLRDLAKIKGAADKLKNTKIDIEGKGSRSAGKLSAEAKEFARALRAAQISYARIRRSTDLLPDQLSRVSRLQDRIKQITDATNKGSNEKLRSERFLTQVARERLRLEREIAKQGQVKPAVGPSKTKQPSAFDTSIRNARIEYARIRRSSSDLNAQLQKTSTLEKAIDGIKNKTSVGSKDRLTAETLLTSVANRRALIERQILQNQIRSGQLVKPLSNAQVDAIKLASSMRAVQASYLAIQRSGADHATRVRDLNNLEQRLLQIKQKTVAGSKEELQVLRAINLVQGRRQALERQISLQAKRRQAQFDREQAKAATQAQQRFKVIQQSLNSISLEAGFLLPFTRLTGNLFRIGSAFTNIARASGLSARATSALSGVLGTLSIVGGGLFLVLGGVARVLFRLASFGLNVVFTPLLRFGTLMLEAAKNAEVLALAVGVLAAKLAVSFGTRLEQITAQFRLAFGAQSRDELKEIVNLADRLGIPLQSITENYAKISIAAKQAGIAQSDVKTLFEGISVSARALGLDAERTSGIFFAFEQIISKGRLSAEELRRQLGDRLPGAFSTAAIALGITTKELDKLLETGSIASSTFIRAIGPELLRQNQATAQALSKGIGAEVERLRLNVTLLGFAFAQRVAPAVARVVRSVTQLVKQFRASAFFRNIVNAIAKEFERLDAFLPTFVKFAKETFNDLAPVVSNLTVLLLQLKTSAFFGLIGVMRALAPEINRVVDSIREFASWLTGIEYDNINVGILGIRQQIVLAGLAAEIFGRKMILAAEKINLASAILAQYSPFKRIREQAEETIEATGRRMLKHYAEISKLTGEMKKLQEDIASGATIDDEEFRSNFREGFANMVQFARQRFAEFMGNARQDSADFKGEFESQQRSGSRGSIVSITDLRNTIEGSIIGGHDAEIARTNEAIVWNTDEIAKNASQILTTIVAVNQKLPEVVNDAIRNLVSRIPTGAQGF